MAITSATGGIITNYTSSGTNYRSHTFLTTDQLQITGSGTVALLIVGGGGGGSLGGGGESNTTNRGNGGGGGGFISRSLSLTAGIWSVAVGDGGLGGTTNISATAGQVSSFGKSATALVSSSYADGAFFQLTGSTVGQFYVTSSTSQVDAAPIYYILTGSTATLTMASIAAKLNTLTSTFNITATGSATNLQLTASVGGLGNTFTYASASITQPFAGEVYVTASYGGFGGQPEGGAGASGGGSYPTGAAAIFADSGSVGGAQGGKSGAGGGGAATAGSDSNVTYVNPFTIYTGGAGGLGVSSSLRNGTGSYYADGGGGGGWVNSGAGGGVGGSGTTGGSTGGGMQSRGGEHGSANTGAGGGGGALSDQSSNWGNGGNGGSGIIVVTYTV
jgi:hypothetical protein